MPEQRSPKRDALNYLLDQQQNVVSDMKSAAEDYEASTQCSSEEQDRAQRIVRLAKRLKRLNTAVAAVKEGR